MATIHGEPEGAELGAAGTEPSVDELSSAEPLETTGTGQVSLRPGTLSIFRSIPGAGRTETEIGSEPEPEIPNRYELREDDSGLTLLCREAPGVAVRINRNFAFSEAEARRLGERVILLDGAGAFGPMVDDSRLLFNLDHHQGCLRAFTLATCEQALILVLKGVELDKGDWTLYANEPDLDTVFALWVLLNYRRLRELGPEARDTIVPLLRLEGSIDANGLEIADYCGLPRNALREERRRLDRLHAIELEKKKNGDWDRLDPASHALDMLLRIDRMVYRATDFQGYAAVEQEYGHVEVGDNRVAVVCRDGAGIYEVEKRLKQAWADRLALVALERAPHQYTLRRVASLAGIDLEDAYARLNLLDPAVDGRPPEKRWGGSDDIGGSPRPHGTGLLPQEIAKILRLTYKPVSPLQRLQRLGETLLWTLTLVLLAAAGTVGIQLLQPHLGVEPLREALPLLTAAGIAAVGAWLLTRRLSRGWTWLFGWRWPAGQDYLALLPLMIVGGAAGGVWVPRGVVPEGAPLAAASAAMLTAAMAMALWFPGLVHGLLILESRVQTVRGRWFLSWPAAVSGALYAGVTLLSLWLLTRPPTSLGLAAPWPWVIAGIGALLCGLAAAMMRERSLSIWPAVVGFATGCVARLLVDLYFR